MDYGGQQTISDYDQKGMIMTAEEFYLPKDKINLFLGKDGKLLKIFLGKYQKEIGIIILWIIINLLD